MDVRQRVPVDFSDYFAHFTRSDYPAFFRRYTALAGPVLAALSSPAEAEAAAAELVAHCGTLLRPLRRKVILFDLKSLFTLYTVPAALEHGGEAAEAFAQRLAEEWNRQYPAFSFAIGTYGELMKGFENAKLLGFDIKWGGKKDEK